jgi:hypothetical protein
VADEHKPSWPRPDYPERAARRAELHSQGIKGMFLLHGGAVISLLTFLTQVAERTDDTHQIVRYTAVAIGLFVVGLILLAPINHLRYEGSRLFDHATTKPKGKKYGLAHRILFWSSLVFFVAGVSVALAGVWIWKA